MFLEEKCVELIKMLYELFMIENEKSLMNWFMVNKCMWDFLLVFDSDFVEDVLFFVFV